MDELYLVFHLPKRFTAGHAEDNNGGVPAVRLTVGRLKELMAATELTRCTTYEDDGFYVRLEGNEAVLAVGSFYYESEWAEVNLPIGSTMFNCEWLLSQVEALANADAEFSCTEDCVRAYDEIYVIGTGGRGSWVLRNIEDFCVFMRSKTSEGFYGTSLVRSLRSGTDHRLKEEVRLAIADMKLKGATEAPVYMVLNALNERAEYFNNRRGGGL